MNRLGQVAVELHDVGPDPHRLGKPGVTGAGVVERDQGAALAQLGEGASEVVVVGDELVLRDLDHDPVQIRRAAL